MSIERRKYVRFLTNKNTFASLRNGFKKVGKIIDISINGLAFSYLSEKSKVSFDPRYSHVDIFLIENGFYLPNVPCKIVYNIPEITSDKGLFIKLSRCGMQFEELTKNQSEQLELFIENYTAEQSS